MRKWANRIFTAVAIVGWVVLIALTLDGIFNNSKMTIGILLK